MTRLLTSCLGLGWLPLAPGTWGSLPAALIFAILCWLGAPGAAVAMTMGGLALIGAIACVCFAPAAIAATGKSDPREVVADELAGQAVTLLPIALLIAPPSSTNHIWILAGLGFLLFRVFDIAKPWPIRKLEKLPLGWGVLADDLMAGLYAAVCLVLLWRTGWVEWLSHSTIFTGQFNILYAVVLGAVQGLTEFLPVSSSGHLVLLETIFHLEPENRAMLLFDLAIHLGTLVSIFVVFRRPFGAYLKSLAQATGVIRGSPQAGTGKGIMHLLVLVAVATVVTGALGMFFEKQFVASRGSLALLSVMWVINATVLLISDRRRTEGVPVRQFSIVRAGLVGIAQAVAIFPSISRSGATISTAILLGLNRSDSVEFSFILAIPAILGAAILEFREHGAVLFSAGGSSLICSAVIGAVVAGLVGVAALKIMIRTAKTAKLKFFAFYCYGLACIVLILTVW